MSARRLTAFKIWFAIVIIASYFTTAHGITTLLGGEGYLKYLVGYAGSLLLQLSIIVAWRGVGTAFGNRAWKSMTALCLVAVTVSVASAVLASSTNVDIFNHSFLVDKAASETRTVVIAPVDMVAAFTQQLSGQLDDYANFAKGRADEEKFAGTSCEGPPKAAQCGAICRLRNAQSERALEFAQTARSLNSEAVDLQVGSVSMRTQEEVNDLFRKTHALANSQQISQIRAWADQQEQGFMNGFAFEGEVLQCSDPRAVEMISSIKATAATPVDIPSAPPTVTEQGVGDSAYRNLQALGSLMGTVLASPAGVGPYLNRPDVSPFVIPWAIAFLIELVCAALAAIEGWMQRRQFGEPSGRVLDPASRKAHQDILKALRSLSVHEYAYGRRHSWLLIPMDGDPLPFEIQNLPYALRLKQPVMRGPVGLDQITQNEATRQQIQSFAPGASIYTLWTFHNYDAKIRELVDQLGLHNGGGGSGTPPSDRRDHLKIVR